MSGKYALVIANTEYKDAGLAQLTAPGRDAEDFARVLRDKDIGAFDDVKVLLNSSEPDARGAIEEFFDQKKSDDLLVLYFSGHGVRDEVGSLYLALKNTTRHRLRSTALKSDFIRESIDRTYSKRVVLILDCCNSGAFAQGTKAATGVSIGTASAFDATGYGRIVLTASDSTQFAWEGDKVIGGEAHNSLFTHFLVQGLEGEADHDGDGRITVDELFDYAYKNVRLATPKQTPSKFSDKQQGEIVLRQSTRIENIKPVPLPDYLLEKMNDTYAPVRELTVKELEKLAKGKNLGLARSAREALEKLAEEDDSRRVAQLASQVLETIRQAEELAAQKAEEERLAREKMEAEKKAEAERKAMEEAQRLAAQKAEEERIAREKFEAEQKAEAERKAKEEAQRLTAQKAEDERLAREKLEAERKAKEEAQRFAAQKAEEERLAREKIEAEQKAEAEREAKEEAQRFAAQKAEEERVAREKMEAEQKAEAEREAREEVQRFAAQKAEEERLAREKLEAERKAREEQVQVDWTRTETEFQGKVKARSWFQIWIKAITKPGQQTFSEIVTSPVATTSKVYLGIFIVGAISALMQVLTLAISSGISIGEIFSSISPTLLVIMAVVPPLEGVLFIVIFAIGVAFTQWVAKLLGGVGTFSKLVYASATIYIPFTLVSSLLSSFIGAPVLGIFTLLLGLGISIYWLFLQVIAVKVVNQFSWGKAIGSVLTPPLAVLILCCVPSVIFWSYSDSIIQSLGGY